MAPVAAACLLALLRGAEGRGAPPSACPGRVAFRGLDGPAAIVPAGWAEGQDTADRSLVTVGDGGTLAPHMGARAYFAEACSAGAYRREEYLSLEVLGKTLRYTVNVSGAGCGCVAALYLVPMRHNQEAGDCGDFYCDSADVCGTSCTEIDLQEANQYAWHSTLHEANDPDGHSAGYGGSDIGNGPRDFGGLQYGPGGECVDTSQPFDVAASFPVDAAGALAGVDIRLSQDGHPCQLDLFLPAGSRMKEIGDTLARGVTLVASYWSSSSLQWLDGKGDDGRGPCESDHPLQCPASVAFGGFSLAPLEAGASRPLAADLGAAPDQLDILGALPPPPASPAGGRVTRGLLVRLRRGDSDAAGGAGAGALGVALFVVGALTLVAMGAAAWHLSAAQRARPALTTEALEGGLQQCLDGAAWLGTRLEHGGEWVRSVVPAGLQQCQPGLQQCQAGVQAGAEQCWSGQCQPGLQQCRAGLQQCHAGVQAGVEQCWSGKPGSQQPHQQSARPLQCKAGPELGPSGARAPGAVPDGRRPRAPPGVGRQGRR
ncbi:unnamed protein product [Prorocentrum cordatum]|uniref:cellulose 1,4-beta-cellobiosidase (non-reducing end) n=1 Tax=Prorocentrum cordatum TaxID=2364126 RepID=A0ABN9UPE2_9DINO|nr:unnamed protein product [Polarella glacialis]